MSEQEPAGPDWREAVAMSEEGPDAPRVVMRHSGATAHELLSKVLANGQWDEQSEPGLAPLLELTLELLDDDSVLRWMRREIIVAAEEPAAREVRTSFESYQRAVTVDDLDTVADLMDDYTRTVFSKYRELAMDGGGALPASDTPMVDRICVELFRIVFTPDELKAMDDEQAIMFSVNHIFSGPEGFEQFHIGEIEIDGDDAAAELFAGGTLLPIRIAFRYEGGEWRVSIASMFPLIETTYAAMAQQEGESTDTFVERFLEAARAQAPR